VEITNGRLPENRRSQQARTGSDRRECAFFNELSDVYGYRPTVHPVVTSSSTGKGDSKSVQTGEKDGYNTSPSPDDPCICERAFGDVLHCAKQSVAQIILRRLPLKGF